MFKYVLCLIALVPLMSLGQTPLQDEANLPSPVPPALAPLVQFVERDDVQIDISVGAVIGETEPDNPKGEVPFWLKASYVKEFDNGTFSEFGLSHRSNVERNGDEVACDSWFSSLGYQKNKFFGSSTVHKCFNSSEFSEGDYIYEYQLGLDFGRPYVAWFHIDVEGSSEFNYRVEGVKVGYKF